MNITQHAQDGLQLRGLKHPAYLAHAHFGRGPAPGIFRQTGNDAADHIAVGLGDERGGHRLIAFGFIRRDKNAYQAEERENREPTPWKEHAD
jgi:hypothetical protein